MPAEQDWTIFQVQRHDLVELQQLQELLFPITYGPKFYQMLLQPPSLAFIVRSTRTSKIIAFATCRIETRVRCCQVFQTPICYLLTFGVHPALQSQGLGSFTIQYLVSILRQLSVEQIELDVLRDNNRAIQFYKKHGFIVKHIVENYYHIQGEYFDSFRMALALKLSFWLLISWPPSVGLHQCCRLLSQERPTERKVLHPYNNHYLSMVV